METLLSPLVLGSHLNIVQLYRMQHIWIPSCTYLLSVRHSLYPIFKGPFYSSSSADAAFKATSVRLLSANPVRRGCKLNCASVPRRLRIASLTSFMVVAASIPVIKRMISSLGLAATLLSVSLLVITIVSSLILPHSFDSWISMSPFLVLLTVFILITSLRMSVFILQGFISTLSYGQFSEFRTMIASTMFLLFFVVPFVAASVENILPLVVTRPVSASVS